MRLTLQRTEGGPIEYESVPGEGPPLVFLHEGLGSTALWRGVPAEVAAATGRAACTYSRYGDGASIAHPRLRATVARDRRRRARGRRRRGRVSGPCEVLRLDGSGHSPHLERREETVDALVGFVTRFRRS